MTQNTEKYCWQVQVVGHPRDEWKEETAERVKRMAAAAYSDHDFFLHGMSDEPEKAYVRRLNHRLFVRYTRREWLSPIPANNTDEGDE